VAGVGIGAAVLGTKVALGSARHHDDSRSLSYDSAASISARSRDRLPDPPRGSAQALLLRRAEGAVDRLGRLTGTTGDRWLAEELGNATRDARGLLDPLAEMAGRITLLEASVAAAAPESLTDEIRSVQARLARVADPELRAELEKALTALDSQADSIDRLLRRRDGLLAQLHASTVSLEGLATKGGELVALGPATADPQQVNGMLSELTGSLDAVRAGGEEARNVLREL
jgi:hypothetical protein